MAGGSEMLRRQKPSDTFPLYLATVNNGSVFSIRHKHGCVLGYGAGHSLPPSVSY